jgi:hypothetical protein
MEESSEARRRLTLSAALARLMPPGVGPGAVEAGAADYVERRVAATGAEAALLANGLDLLERRALDLAGLPFAALEPARQDEVLRALAVESEAGAACLRRLVLLALEGSFCHPARGGNRGGVGWRFVGLVDDAEPPDPLRCRAS